MFDTPIDLLRCGRRFKKKFATRPFGMPLVEVALRIASERMTDTEERVLNECLMVLINQVEYSQCIGFIPLPFSHTRINQSGHDNDAVVYVAQSIVATVRLYRFQLNSLVNRSQMSRGVEWAVDAIERGVFLESLGAEARRELPLLTEEYIEEWKESIRRITANY